LPASMAARLQLVLETGRRSLVAKISADPDLRDWLSALDHVAALHAAGRPSVLPSRETVWITTAEAAKRLGLSTRQVRNLAGKIRAERHGSVLVFDLDDVLEEIEARRDAGISPAGIAEAS